MRAVVGAIGLFALLVPVVFGCDDKRSELETRGKEKEVPSASVSVPVASAKPDAAAKVAMPERPVPTTNPTVSMGAPEEVQMKAIVYMTAMSAPHPDDAAVDHAFVESLVKELKPIGMSMDKGSGADKARLGRVDVLGGGRRVDVLMAQGCEDRTPTRIVLAVNKPLSVLASRGVLVVACHDTKVQCLQSTRDATDVLCTSAPRK